MMSHSEFTGKVLGDGRYQIHSQIGEGGMGQVFLGRDQRLENQVVIKMPHRNMMDSGFAERFRREIKSLVLLSHPSIVSVLDVGEFEGLPFAVMQYLGGGSLSDRLTSKPAEALAGLRTWLPSIAKALDFIHAKGYLHRDVKPANILFDSNGHAFLSDFGIAKVVSEVEEKARQMSLTGTGMAMGTPEYMAPELCDGSAIDHRVDQYALAIVVYEMLAGRCPLIGATPLATIFMHKTHQAKALHTVVPAIPDEVSRVVEKGMDKSPANRFTSCTEFATRAIQAAYQAARQNASSSVASVASPEVERASVVSTEQAHSDKTTLRKISASAKANTNPPDGSSPASKGDVRRETCPVCRRVLRIPMNFPTGRGVSCPNCQAQLEWGLQGLRQVPIASEKRGTAKNDMSDTLSGHQQLVPVELVTTTSPPNPAAPNPAVSFGSVAPARTSKPKRSCLRRLLMVLMLIIVSFVVSVAVMLWVMRVGWPRFSSNWTNSVQMQMIRIPAGSFEMGSPASELLRDQDESLHHVSISNDFYMSATEVTQKQWQDVMGTKPWSGKSSRTVGPNYPAVDVSWHDAVAFCKKLSEKEGREYRLPTEAEWEYACRAGSKSAYCFGSDPKQLQDYAWWGATNGNPSAANLHQVATKKPNAFGLYDMHGNVWEWCQDWFAKDYYSRSPKTDPTGPSSGTTRVERGGNWSDGAKYCRSAYRGNSKPSSSGNLLGFRVVATSKSTTQGKEPTSKSGSSSGKEGDIFGPQGSGGMF